jgi:hypothetical protein
MRESAIERECSIVAQVAGWYECKIKSANKRGVPDHIYHRAGITFYVEFKTDVGRLSVHQKKIIDELRRQLIPVYVVTSVLEFRALLNRVIRDVKQE